MGQHAGQFFFSAELPREILYRRTPGRWNFTAEELHEDQANYAYKICAEFSPPPGNCAQDIYNFLSQGLARRESNRWDEKCTAEHYRTLAKAREREQVDRERQSAMERARNRAGTGVSVAVAEEAEAAASGRGLSEE